MRTAKYLVRVCLNDGSFCPSVCPPVCLSACLSTCICACTYVCTHACMQACMYVRLSKRLSAWGGDRWALFMNIWISTFCSASQFFDGELGGPAGSKWISGLLIISVWIFYITVLSLKSYDIIQWQPSLPQSSCKSKSWTMPYNTMQLGKVPYQTISPHNTHTHAHMISHLTRLQAISRSSPIFPRNSLYQAPFLILTSNFLASFCPSCTGLVCFTDSVSYLTNVLPPTPPRNVCFPTSDREENQS